MRIITILLALLIFTFSCKTDEKKDSTIENKKDITVASDFKLIGQQEYLVPEYYNKTISLGIGLLKPKKDSLIFQENLSSKINKESIFKPKSIIPIFFKPDYSIFFIVCKEKTGDNYRVLSSNNKEYLVNKSDYDFISWNKLLKETTGIENLDWIENPILKEPNTNSEKITINNKSDFIVKKVENNWIYIENESGEKGWIKWRNNQELLIEIYLLM